MKKFCWILYIFIHLFLLISCSSTDVDTKNTVSPVPEIFIKQDGLLLPVSESTVELRKMPFSIVVRFSKPGSIMLNASLSSETFNNALSGHQVNSLRGFKKTAIDEEPFNKSKALYISTETPQVWYYTDDSDHSFNSTEKIENYTICTREISFLIDYDSGNKQIEITKLKENFIYLVIISFDWNEDFTQIREKDRKLLRLKFIF
ncbi:MAG TPA: hypothetical protein PLN03_06905 [Spirochaetota bacterium]|nr:hypothetical protein [Spirochaetota bacterium]